MMYNGDEYISFGLIALIGQCIMQKKKYFFTFK